MAAVFEGFFDLETGEPRRPGQGIPRLRVIPPAASAAPAIAAPGPAADVTAVPPAADATPLGAGPPAEPTAATGPTASTEPTEPSATSGSTASAALTSSAASAGPTASGAPTRVPPPAIERLWGFECWWRPDPAQAGATPSDHEELELSKRLLRGLQRDTRRAGRSLQPR